jgi:hypothetical protein
VEKLKRFDPKDSDSTSTGMSEWPSGDYVLYSAAHTREKVLVEALRKLAAACVLADIQGELSSLVDGSLLDAAYTILDQIDAESEQ